MFTYFRLLARWFICVGRLDHDQDFILFNFQVIVFKIFNREWIFTIVNYRKFNSSKNRTLRFSNLEKTVSRNYFCRKRGIKCLIPNFWWQSAIKAKSSKLDSNFLNFSYLNLTLKKISWKLWKICFFRKIDSP